MLETLNELQISLYGGFALYAMVSMLLAAVIFISEMVKFIKKIATKWRTARG